MDLGIKFPDEAAEQAAEAARFRALPAAEQVRALDEMFKLYHFLLDRSPERERLMALAELEEERGRRAVLEMADRHGGR